MVGKKIESPEAIVGVKWIRLLKYIPTVLGEILKGNYPLEIILSL